MALTVARIRGIPVRLHWAFLAVLPLFGFLMGRAYFATDGGAVDASAWLWGSLLAVGLFASVLAHELAHSLVAIHEGIRVRHITLLPFGGVSAFEELPRTPRIELRVTAVGPLTNFILGIPMVAIALAAGASPPATDGFFAFLFWLGALNILIGAFNLFLPAFPMDGGRILRALLTRPFGRVRATTIAAGVGRGFAVAMGVWGFLTFANGGWLLLLIAFFVFAGASQEEQGVRVAETLGRYRVDELMTRHVESLAPGDSVAAAFSQMFATKHVTLPVTSGGRLEGVVALDDLGAVPVAERDWTPVSSLMRAEVPTLAPADSATEAQMLLARSEGRVPILVVDSTGALVGIVTHTDLQRAVAIADARSRDRIGRGPAGGRAT